MARSSTPCNTDSALGAGAGEQLRYVRFYPYSASGRDHHPAGQGNSGEKSAIPGRSRSIKQGNYSYEKCTHRYPRVSAARADLCLRGLRDHVRSPGYDFDDEGCAAGIKSARPGRLHRQPVQIHVSIDTFTARMRHRF